MDNFYNSVELSETLLERNIYTFGTLRSFRDKPPEIRKLENLAKHGMLAKDNGKAVVMVYKIEDRNPKASVDDPIDRLRGGFKFHRLETYEHSASTKYSQKRWRVCSRKENRRQTRYFWIKCKVLLYVVGCFFYCITI